jgi:membrane-bound ClpP family serine protease
LEKIMTNQNNQTTVDVQKRNAELDARLGDIGWAVLLITVGTIWLLPEKQVPQGSWLIAAGLILLGLNAIRYFNGIRMSGFSLVLGTLVLLAGIGEFFAWHLPLFAIALIVIGACMLFKPLVERKLDFPVSYGCCCEWPGDQGTAARH